MAQPSAMGDAVTDAPSGKTPIPLSTEQKQEILKVLGQKWIGRRECPVCTTNAWELSEHATTPVTLNGLTGDLQIFGPGTIYPQVGLICTNCGFTRQFNLVVLGLMKSPTEKPKQTDQSGPTPAADPKNG